MTAKNMNKIVKEYSLLLVEAMLPYPTKKRKNKIRFFRILNLQILPVVNTERT